MYKSRLVLGSIVLAAAFLSPLAASAQAIPFSFGGRIAMITPCLSPFGPSLWVQIVQPVPKVPTILSLIWTPGTITFLSGPPRNPGQALLGLFDTPLVCMVGSVPLPGFRMTMVGTSPVI